ncbi:MAG TPA: DUF222 domain-containing protein [Thermoleophilaceae bacterium]
MSLREEAGRPLELLEREISELAAHIHAATCRWLVLVGEYDRREGWAQWGCKSCAQWLSWQCSLAPSAAREQVRVARRLAELPLITAAFGRGELSYSQVRAMSRVATPEVEESMLELARFSTAAQLERMLRGYRGVVERELSPDERTHGSAYLVCEHDDDGSLLLRGRLPAEEGALMLAALEAARDSLRAEPDGDADPEREAAAESDVASTPNGYRSASAEAPPSNAAALVLMSETVLSAGAAGRSPADSYQVFVHVDADTLGAEDGGGQLEDGSPLHPETARRLACDASIVRILERDGRPLSVGRRTRSVPPALRRALQTRDHCCRFPGCTQRRFLHAHHIEHWAHGGATDLDNLVHLCRFHHRLVHEGGYRLERSGRRGTLRFRRPDGLPLLPVPDRRAGHEPDLRRGNRRAGARIGPETCVPDWTGERIDLPLCVDALVIRDPRLYTPPGVDCGVDGQVA